MISATFAALRLVVSYRYLLGVSNPQTKSRMKFKTSTESAIACDSADRLLRHLRVSFQDFHSIIPTGASSPLCNACEEAYIKYPPWEEPPGLTPQAASLKTPKFKLSSGIAWICMGKLSSRWACRMIWFAFCKLSIVGFDVWLAESDTLADKSKREFVQSHCNEQFITRSGF